MDSKKLPFKTYTVMSNNLIQTLGCADVYRTYTLLLIANTEFLKTNTTLEQLAGYVGETLQNYKHPRGPPHPSWLRHATFSPAGRRLDLF